MGWLMGLSPWLQVPLIVVLALPACAAVSYVLLWVCLLYTSDAADDLLTV